MPSDQLEVELSGLALLHEISSRMVREGDLPALLDQLVEAAVAIVGADMGAVQLLDADSGTLRIQAQRGVDPPLLRHFSSVGPGHASASGTVLVRGERVIVEDVEESSIFVGTPQLEAIRAAGIRAVQSTPMLSRSGQLMGALTTHYRSPRRPSEVELRLLDLLVRQGADLIERARIESALRESESRYRCLMELLPAGVYTCAAPGGVIQYYNRHAAELWGREPVAGDTDERFCGSFRLYTADGKPLAHADTPMADVLRDGRPVRNREVIIERPGGSRVTVAVNIDPLRDLDGRLTGAINVFRDVTEQKKQEQQQAQLAAIVESSADAIVSKSLDGIIRSWNWGAQKIFGYTEAETIGKPITMIIPPERHAEEKSILERVRRGERVEHFETVRVAKDGRRLDMSLTISPVRDRTGRIVGASKIGRDITERERSRRELEAANAALKRSNADLEQFAHSASHDLQEPLRMILLYSDILEHEYGGRIGEQAEDYVRRISTSASRLEKLLRDLRSYVEVSMSATAPARAVSANAALAATLSDLSAAIEENGAVITSETLPDVAMQQMHLEQLFQNLIGNAIKYRSEKPPRIHVSASRGDGQWLFAVRDNGIGIDPSYLKDIFEMFKRLHSRDKYEGTGMGLAICKRIIERYGGRIWAESAEGAGSSFFFTAPPADTKSDRQELQPTRRS